MKNIFKSLLCGCILALCTAAITSCSDETKDADGLSGSGFSNINNPSEGSSVSKYGETISITFTADAAWDATLETSDKETWAKINAMTNNTAAGKGTIRMTLAQNSHAERSVKVLVTVKGHAQALLCTLTQAGGEGGSPELNTALNTAMDGLLKTNYLWNKEYSQIANISLSGAYDEFLYKHLTKLGNVNIEDGGLYRAYSSLSGQRYIYSYIQEINPSSRASMKTGFGTGQTLSMKLFADKSNVGLILGYVYPQSPASTAGLVRGDIIYNVNGADLVPANYAQIQNSLFYATSGSYAIQYYRYEMVNNKLQMIKHETTVTAGTYAYNPVLMAAVIQSRPGISPAYNIGYLVLESFDAPSHEALQQTLMDFKTKGITDLILDLRFNYGGAVMESRYLMSSIVGSANYDKTYAKMTFNDNSEQIWTFGNGYQQEPDGLGKGPDLGLKRLYVICSENTASAAEIVIIAAQGIDFPIHLYGSKTEGKNVGMVTTTLNRDGRRFEFAPITFFVKNAKDFADYADGITPEHLVNNQNQNWEDDIDPYFPYLPADWGDMNDNAFYWALLNCTSGKDPDFTPTASKVAGRTRAGMTQHLQFMKTTDVKPEIGRFGNIIYGKEEIILK